MKRQIYIKNNLIEHFDVLGRAYYPQEICGILTGRNLNGLYTVRNFHWIDNISKEPGKWDFTMDPEQYMDVVRAFISSKFSEVVGIFHTHPNGPSVPSLIDTKYATQAGDKIPWVIYSVRDKQTQSWYYNGKEFELMDVEEIYE